MSEAESSQLPGCGLAGFVLILFGIFVVGMSGVIFSTCNVLRSGDALSPRRLTYGGVVDPVMLAPLREAGLIGRDEVPDAFHAENEDGTEACAVSGGEVMHLGPDGGKEMPISSITSVTGSDTEVVIHGDTTIVCRFGPDEGGGRFRRMLENR